MPTGRIIQKAPLQAECRVCGVQWSPDIRPGGRCSLRCPHGCIETRDGSFIHHDGHLFQSKTDRKRSAALQRDMDDFGEYMRSHDPELFEVLRYKG